MAALAIWAVLAALAVLVYVRYVDLEQPFSRTVILSVGVRVEFIDGFPGF